MPTFALRRFDWRASESCRLLPSFQDDLRSGPCRSSRIGDCVREDRSAEMPKLWTGLAARYDGKDRWYLEALGIAATDRWSECIQEWLKSNGNQLKSAAARDILWRARSSEAASKLTSLLLDPSLSDSEMERMVRGLEFQSQEVKTASFQKLLQSASTLGNERADRIAIESAMRLGTDVQSDPSLKQAVDRTLAKLGNNPSQLRLIRQLKVDGMNQRLMDLLSVWEPGNDSVQPSICCLAKKGETRFAR